MKEMVKQQRMLGIMPDHEKEERQSQLLTNTNLSKSFETPKKKVKNSKPCCSLYQDSFVISTRTPYFQAWRIFLILMTIAQCCYYMFCAGFRHDLEYSTYEEYLQFGIGSKFSEDDIYTLNVIQEFFEGVFLLHIIVQFFTEYLPFDSLKPERSLEKIAKKYLKGTFIFDAFAQLQLEHIFKFRNSRLLTIIHMLRLVNLANFLDVKVLFREIKAIYQKQLEKDC